MEALFSNWTLLALLLGGGAVAGFIAGLLGVGGGIVLVPVLFQLLIFMETAREPQMHIAVGTSLAIIIATGARATISQIQRQALNWLMLRNYAVPMMLGAAAGAWLAGYIPGGGLKLLFAIVLMGVAVRLWFFPQWGTQARRHFSLMAQRLWGGAIGMISAWLGIGGGVFTVSLLRMAGQPMHRAVATSSGLGVCLAITGTIGFAAAGFARQDLPSYSLGYIYLPGLLIAITGMAFAPLGVRASHAFTPRQLEVVFGVVLLMSALRMVWAAF